MYNTDGITRYVQQQEYQQEGIAVLEVWVLFDDDWFSGKLFTMNDLCA